MPLEIPDNPDFALDPELRFILGRVCFMCRDIAKVLMLSKRYAVAAKAEDEQAVAIHWMLGHYFKHGPTKWQAEAEKEIRELAEKLDADRQAPEPICHPSTK
jgi:hypothetical protein